MHKSANFNKFATLIHVNNTVGIGQTMDAAAGGIVVPHAYPVVQSGWGRALHSFNARSSPAAGERPSSSSASPTR